MTDKMTVAIAAGGTAGHINPALALAEELRDRGHHVVFVGQSRKLEGRLVPEAGFDFVPITVTGLRPLPSLDGADLAVACQQGQTCARQSFLKGRASPMPPLVLVPMSRFRCWGGARARAFRICCMSRTLFRPGQQDDELPRRPRVHLGAGSAFGL